MNLQRVSGWVRWCLAAAAVALTAAACGSSSSSSSSSAASGATSSSTAASTSTGTPSSGATSFKGTIKVGMVGDFTGDLQLAAGYQGAQAYIDAVNNTGGVDGYKIQTTQYDTASAPASAVQAFRRAIAAKPTALLAGSFVAASGLPAVAQSGIPTVGDGTAPGWTGHKNMFPVLGDEATHISDILEVVAHKYGGASKLALIGSNLYTADLANLEKSAPSAGVKLVLKDLTLPLVPSSAQLLSLAEQIKSSGAQAVAGIGVENETQLQIDLNQLKSGVKVVSTDFFEPNSTENGLLYSEPWANNHITGDPGVTQYVKDMTKAGYAKDIESQSFAPLRYGMAALLVSALKQAGPPFSSASLIKALGQTKHFTADGILPALSYPAFQTVGDHCQSVLQVVNGAWKPLTTGPNPFLCGGPSRPDS